MKTRKYKQRNLFKLLPLLFLLSGLFAFNGHKSINKNVVQTAATSAAYGEFSLPDESKWIYVHATTGSDATARTGKTLSDPVKTLGRALTLANEGDAIMLLSSISGLSSAIQITKKVIIASSPTDANGNPITYVHTITRSASGTNDMFHVKTGGELHLSRIEIHGNRTLSDAGKKDGALVRLGELNPDDPAKLYVHTGATLRRGNRTAGGSAILLVDGILYMNGGKIVSNYTPGTYTLIGPLTGSTYNEAYLISGEISNNTGAGNFVGIRHTSLKEIVIGADFVVENNTTNETGDLLPHYGDINVKIINNFTERTKFHATGLDGYTLTIVIVDEDFVPLETQPEVFMFYESYVDSYLYPHYIDGKYVWKYFYSEDFKVVTMPTASTPGVLARKAHVDDDGDGAPIYSNTNYVDEIELPILNTTAYENVTLHSDTLAITYDFIHEGETYVLTYDVPLTDYVWRVSSAPSLNASGTLVREHPSYPGIIFATEQLPILSPANYAVNVTSDEVIYTHTDSEGVAHNINVTRPSDGGYVWETVATPTHTNSGSAKLVHPEFSEVVFATHTLPALNEDDYTAVLTDGEVVYSYYEEATELTLTFTNALPESDFVTGAIVVLPTSEAAGNTTLTHPTLPALTIDVVLPKLNDTDYDVVVVGNNAVYNYVEPITEHIITFSLPLPEVGYDVPLVTSVPTKDSGGLAVVNHPDIPGAQIEINLPGLSDASYSASQAGANAVYSYVDDDSGFTVDVVLALPETDYSAVTTTTIPSKTTSGNATITHPDLPNLQLEITLPQLNGNDYAVTYDESDAFYVYEDNNTGLSVPLTFALPTEGYNASVTTVNPTTATPGVATVTHPDLPGLEITAPLPKLSTDDYTNVVEGTNVIFTHTDSEGELITVTVPLPEHGYDEEVVATKPSINSNGSATLTHPALPGVEITVELPKLSEEDYEITVNTTEDVTTGTVVYTYTDEATNAEVAIELAYDYDDLNWIVADKPTKDDTGTIVGSDKNLPGAEFEITLPSLNDNDYDVVDNRDGTSTYTYKNTTRGTFAFIVDNEVASKNLWPIIIVEFIVALALTALAVYKILTNKKKDKTAPTAMNVLPLILFAKYIPSGAIAMIIILALLIVMLGVLNLYLFIFKKDKKEENEVQKQ